MGTAASTGGMLILAAIWAITEYHNAGGWPTRAVGRTLADGHPAMNNPAYELLTYAPRDEGPDIG
jgi:hypothetical protein